MPTPTSMKQAPAERVRSARRAVSARDVLRVLQRDQARDLVLVNFKAAGFTLDQIGASRAAGEALARALTACEDWLELQHPRWAEDREAIRAVRRRVEGELEGRA